MDKEAIVATKNKVKIHQLINFDVNTSDMIKVSIVVPVCNVEMYLRECLDSVVNQTLKEIEIICVNDGSKDGCEAILEEYARKDKRVKVIDKENAGYGHAMNIGMDMARGEYIGIVESDDYVDIHMYEELYQIAKQNKLDFVKANFNRFTVENGELQLLYNRIVAKECYGRVLTPREETVTFRGVMNTWSGIYNRGFIRKYNIRHNETPGASYQDNGFFFQTFMFADRAYFYEKAFYYNRRDNPNSSVYSNSKMYCMKEEYDYIRKILNINPKYGKKLLPIWWLKKFHNYLFTCDRLDNENLKIFLDVFYSEFKDGYKKQEYNLDIFHEDEKEKLLFLLSNKEAYYEATKRGEKRISIIIPVYNEAQNLEKCLDNIFQQTLKDIEVICIDDGSTDDSLKILNNYKGRYSNLIVLQQENSGAGKARNHGIETATGEFIAFMDADDWYPSTTILKNLYIAAKYHNVEVCGGSFSSFKNNKVITEYDESLAGYTFTENRKVLFSDYQFDYGYHRFIYKAKLLNDNGIRFPDYRRYQDPPFFVRAMISANVFYAIKQVTYCYRKDDTKLKWTKEKLIDMLHGIQDNLLVAKQYGLAKLYYLNLNRVNKDYVKVITSFILPENKDVCLELIKIQGLVDEKMISNALNSKVEEYIIKPIYRGFFGKTNGEYSSDIGTTLSKLNKTIEDLPKLFQLQKENAQLKNDLKLLRGSYSYKIARCITFIPRKIRELKTKKR